MTNRNTVVTGIGANTLAADAGGVGEPGRRPFSARLLAPADRPLHADPITLAAQHEVDARDLPGTLEPSWSETLDRMLLSKPGVLGNHDGEPDMDWFGSEDVHPASDRARPRLERLADTRVILLRRADRP